MPIHKSCPSCGNACALTVRTCTRCGHAFRTLAGKSHVYDASTRNVRWYAIDIWHAGLGKTKTIRGQNEYIVNIDADAAIDQWAKQWQQQEARENKALNQEKQQAIAQRRTEDAANLHESLRSLLIDSLKQSVRIDWEGMKDREPFLKPRPIPPPMPQAPYLAALPPEISRQLPRYVPQFDLIDKFNSKRRQTKIDAANALYQADYQQWQQVCQRIMVSNNAAMQAYNAAVDQSQRTAAALIAQWEQEHVAYAAVQRKQHTDIDVQRQQVEGGTDSAEFYFSYILMQSKYPDFFPKDCEVDYSAMTRTLIVQYGLPAPDAIPSLVEARYVALKNEITEKHLTETQRAKLYDDLLYQVALRSLHELFASDVMGALDAVAWNGYVRSVDRSTGNEVNPCVLTIHVKRDVWSKLNLSSIDPKACFKQLRGVGSSSLYGMAAVAPVLGLLRNDTRFVEGYPVAPYMDEDDNLASMDWEDFEHLIREIFGKEFSVGGGEVKITQASRDGGVDAVAFDPDPIRGGKIVIQAKRYTNTVPVSAVRDLYGTVSHEGAIKGILVTTSDYGPDSYEFASNKPLTLMNGSNLLHLLEKHGHRARINIGEARREAAQANGTQPKART
jgi:restriction system protein